MATNRASVPPSPKIAERLTALLVYYGTKKVVLAKAIGVRPAAVTQWTNGTTAISPSNGKLIAEFFGEDYDFVMGLSDKGSKGLGLFVADIGADRIRRIADLDPDRLTALKSIIDDFVGPNSDGESKP